jgi:hypothetical protein
MRTFTSLALVAALGLGAATLSKPAEAGVVVGVGLPGVAVGVPAPLVAPVPVVYPGYYRYPHVVYPGWGPGWRYGYGGHRGWYHGRWR